jgi:hypothetical protein
MPITLAVSTVGAFDVYRDPSVHSKVSSLTWDDPQILGPVGRPRYLRRNLILYPGDSPPPSQDALYPSPGLWPSTGLYPSGVVVGAVVSGGTLPSTSLLPSTTLLPSPGGVITSALVLAPASGLPITRNLDTSWASDGRDSEIFTMTAPVVPVLQTNPTFVLSAIPGQAYDFGISILNQTSTQKRFYAQVTIGNDIFNGETFSIAPNSDERVTVVGARAPYPHDPTSLPFATTYISRFSFAIFALETFNTGEAFALDAASLTREGTTEFSPFHTYPADELAVGAPIRLWARNTGTTQLKNVRVCGMPSGLDTPRPWLEVSVDPDYESWFSTKQRSHVVQPNYVTAGSTTDFWIRPVIDDLVLQDSVHLSLAISADR